MAGDVGRAAGLKRTAPFNRFGQKSEVELAVLLGLAGERGGGLSTVMGSSGKGLPGLEIVSIGVRRTPPDVVQMDERTPVRQGLSESPQGRIRTGHSAASASVRCGGLLHPENHGGPARGGFHETPGRRSGVVAWSEGHRDRGRRGARGGAGAGRGGIEARFGPPRPMKLVPSTMMM